MTGAQNTTAVPAVKNYYKEYSPSMVAIAVVAGVFGVGLLLNTIHTFRKKAWIWVFMLIGALMETLGWAMRAVSARNSSVKGLFIIQYILIFLAPVFMAGVIYVVFGRLLFRVVPAHRRTVELLWVPARWLTPFFVAFDVVSLVLQAVGGSIMTATDRSNPDSQKTIDMARNIALAGVTLQIIAFGFFIVVAGRFHFTSKEFRNAPDQGLLQGGKFPTGNSGQPQYKPNWRGMLHAINFSCALIMIRSIYREVEFAMGKGSYLDTVEWPTYVLDALPMAGAVLIYTIFRPGDYVSMGFRQPKDVIVALDSRDTSDTEAYAMKQPGSGRQQNIQPHYGRGS